MAKLPSSEYNILPSYKVKYALLPIACAFTSRSAHGLLMIIFSMWLWLVGFDWLHDSFEWYWYRDDILYIYIGQWKNE